VRRLWSNKCVGVLREWYMVVVKKWYIGCVQEVVHRLWARMWYMVVFKGVVHRLCSGSGT
jgi:hypothetical protein